MTADQGQTVLEYSASCHWFLPLRRFSGFVSPFFSDYDVLVALQTRSRYNQLKQWAVIAECVAAPLISSHYKHRRCVANARRHRRGSKCMPDRREPSNRPCFLQYMRTSCSESLLRYRCMEAISSTCGLFWWSMTWVFGWPVMYSLSLIWAEPCIRAMRNVRIQVLVLS